MNYHPVVIEGMSGYDLRNPTQVSEQVTERLLHHWVSKPPIKPLLILTQGDPLEASGIAAITPLVAQSLGVPRGLVYLDEHIADYHWLAADRRGMLFEVPYSALLGQLEHHMPGIANQIGLAIDEQIEEKNRARAIQGKDLLKDYYRDFALLQEVTKAACSKLCDEITIIHTSAEIPPFSVASFYTVGLALGLVNPDDIAAYLAPETR